MKVKIRETTFVYWFCIYYYDVIIEPKAIIMRLCLLFLFQLNTLYSLESRNDQGKIIDILMESKGYQKLNLHLAAKILLLKVKGNWQKLRGKMNELNNKI